MRNAAQLALDGRDDMALQAERLLWKQEATDFLRNKVEDEATATGKRRPVQYRTKMFEWLLLISSQQQVSAGLDWRAFQIPVEVKDRPPLELWPTITVGEDQGGDGWGGGFVLKHKRVCSLVLKDDRHRKFLVC